MNAAPRRPIQPPRRRRDPLEAAIERRAREFDVAALIDLLPNLFPTREVRFRSHETQTPGGTLIEAITVGPRMILVSVNLGLLSPSGPLPSYLIELFSHRAASTHLQKLIERLDDGLLRIRLATFIPEASSRLMGHSEQVRADLLSLARPATSGTLHFLFSAVFPELRVLVQRTALTRPIPVERAQLGRPVLGVAAMGAETEGKVQGFDVVLRTSESETWGNLPWAPEARKRIRERILPRLEVTGTYLRVFLVDEEGRRELAVGGDSVLGFEPLGRAVSPLTTLIFEGCVSMGPMGTAFELLTLTPQTDSTPHLSSGLRIARRIVGT